MRPPSYYNSIVKSNNSHYSSSADFESSAASTRTPSSQLRSSLSSPSSSSYVSRSHLPFVSQSTLVAHCYTGAGSSTRPYSSTNSSSTPSYSSSSRSSPSSSYNSSSNGGSPAASFAWRPPSTKRTHLTASTSAGSTYLTSSSSSFAPTSANYYANSSGSSSRASAYTRPSYLTSSSSSSVSSYVPSRPSYRPITSSNYYKPIRLRERPLLTQISSQIGGRAAGRALHSKLDVESDAPASKSPSESGAKLDKENEQPDESWSSDITRNISRNKYLIKFREIDKQTRASLAEVEVAATIQLPYEPETGEQTERRGRESTVPDREQSETPPELQRTRANNETESKMRLEAGCETDHNSIGLECCDKAASTAEPAIAELDGEKRRKRVAKSALSAPDSGKQDNESESEVKTVAKKERRNVKLKLKSVPRNKQTEEAKAEQLTPKITPASKAAPLVEPAEKKKAASIVPTIPQTKPEAVKENESKAVAVPLQAVASNTEQPEELAEKSVKVKKLIKTSKTRKNSNASASATKTSPSGVEEVKCMTEKTKTEKTKMKDDHISVGDKVAPIKKTGVKKGADQAGEKKLKTKKSSDKIVPNETTQADASAEQKVVLKKAQAQLPDKEIASPPAAAAAAPTSVRVPAKPKGGRIRCRAYNYDDFNFLTVLGHGGWGFVILAELKQHDSYFAVKCIKKITIVEDDDYDSIMIERKVLTLGNVHPFICKLFCTFETAGYLFFVMEYCAGGDLMFHVQREGKFTEPRCRFYAAEIICAIRFLHNRHIIYRDLKLDNILLDARGHIRLVDFGMCQCRTYREEMLPSNFCGTPEYISPEIIKGVPYNHSVDWWSFGVLLYEMAVGKMPFRGNDENELLWNVCYEQIHYPMFLTKELTSLLKALLEREPTKRMGMATCKAGDIYDQPFFRSVDWKAVEGLRVPPPFVPEVTSTSDVQNFDSDFTESTCELSPVDQSTLDKIDQGQFEKFPYTNPEVHIFDSPANLANAATSRL